LKTLGYYNGKIGELDAMSIPMNDRSHWFGDGVYDAAPSRNYHVFALEEHIDRFFDSAALLDIVMPVTKEELRQLLDKLVHKLDTGDLFVYFQVTRGTGLRNHAFTPGPGNLWVMLFPSSWNEGEKPIDVITEEDKRFYFCNIKTLNLIPSVLAAEHAKRQGCEETIFYRHDGRVTECAHSNCHILKDGKLITAPADELILPGIARAHLIRKCKELGIGVSETPYYKEALFTADEVLVTSSSNFCLRVAHIDGQAVGGRAPELYERLRQSLVAEFLHATSDN